MMRIESLMEDRSISLKDLFQYLLPRRCIDNVDAGGRVSIRSQRSISSDEHIFIGSTTMHAVLRLVFALIATSTLMAPILVLSAISSTMAHLSVIFVSATAFLAAALLLAHMKTLELLAGGGSYATALVVFMSTAQVTYDCEQAVARS